MNTNTSCHVMRLSTLTLYHGEGAPEYPPVICWRR
jgi:hypothetical protein